MTSLSVLICTYNRPQLLARCLDALLTRTGERPDQVVVVNGGDERTDAEVRRWQHQAGTGVVLVRTRNINLATSRNTGLPRCTGDLIAMTDDDAEVFPDWVTQLKRVHAARPNAGAVGGAVLSVDTRTLLSRVADRITFPAWPAARAVRTLPGVNISYKRQVVEQVGLQDTSLFRGEDVDYNWRVQKLGFEIYFDPAMRVYHHHRPTWRALLNQQYMYGRAYYLVRRKWPEMYCVYPHRLSGPRSLLKAVNFGASIWYEPLLYAARMARAADKLPAYPLLLSLQLAWRAGMLRQKWLVSTGTG